MPGMLYFGVLVTYVCVCIYTYAKIIFLYIESQVLNKSVLKSQWLMATKHIKICLTLVIIREVQIKTTVRYHYTWL